MARLYRNLLTRVLPIHHLFAWHGCRYKNSLLMQFPNDLGVYLGDSVCSRLAWIDQTKRSICADVATEQPAFIQLFHHFSSMVEAQRYLQDPYRTPAGIARCRPPSLAFEQGLTL